MSVFKRILVAYDDACDSRAALELAIELARDQHASLTVLTVVPDVAGAAATSAGAEQAIEQAATEAQRRARDAVPEDISVTSVLKHGAPARCIVECAEGHDLVVMGTHGRGRVGEALIGSVSRDVVHSRRGAVLVVRSPDKTTHQ